MIHTSSKLRAFGEDALLVAVPALLVATHTQAAWAWFLAAAGLGVLAWNAITLHFPREVETTEKGIALRAFGREHVYAWSECSFRVRRFLMKDRVLLRITDRASGRSGRYWLVASLSEFPALVLRVTSAERERGEHVLNALASPDHGVDRVQ